MSDKKPKDNYRDEAIHKRSEGKLTVTQESPQGSYVVANDSLQPGQVLLECPSASISLDPRYRQTHCGYCAKPLQVPSCCSQCHVVAVCGDCESQGASTWHDKSGECQALSSLMDGFGRVFSEFEGMTRQQVAQNVESIYIITVRLVHRRQSSFAPCPLPEIDWTLMDRLYTSPLPPASSGLVTAISNLLQAMNQELSKKQQPTIPPQECLDVWNKCRGCCHGIADLTRPLGEQGLGMALFVEQSFYNHGCAPNAFLSCCDGSSIGRQHQCAVMSRVVCCSDKAVGKGEPVLLSYISLSGLCWRERQIRLKENYQFECKCTICRDHNKPQSEGYEIEKAVGGEFAASDEELNQTLGPLRELQIECHQNLMAATTMPVVSNEEEDPRTDCIEQCIATLRMAQRGIRNNKVPTSHEVALECRRLLALAYSMLRDSQNDASTEEWNHQQEFFQAASKANSIMDPSALAIQHELAAVCLQNLLHAQNTKERQYLLNQKEFHSKEAIRLATGAVGEGHPFVLSLQLTDTTAKTMDIESNKKRKLDEDAT